MSTGNMLDMDIDSVPFEGGLQKFLAQGVGLNRQPWHISHTTFFLGICVTVPRAKPGGISLALIYWKNPGRQDMSFTPFILSVLPVYTHWWISIGAASMNSSSVLPSLLLDFPIVGCQQTLPAGKGACWKGMHLWHGEVTCTCIYLSGVTSVMFVNTAQISIGWLHISMETWSGQCVVYKQCTDLNRKDSALDSSKGETTQKVRVRFSKIWN